MNLTAVWLAAAALLGSPFAGSQPQTQAPQAAIQHCQVFLIDDVDVPALETGPLVAMHVKEGDFVRKDDVLAQIDHRQAQLQKLAAELEQDAAQARAEDDIEVRYAVKSFELAEAELNQDLDINRRSPGAVPATEIRRKQLARHRAELQIDRSRLDIKVARLNAEVQDATVKAAEESILRRRIVAPFDGTVIDVYCKASEWVNAGKPVLRVVRMDRLRVDGFLSGDDFTAAEVAGRPVTVEIELAHGRKARFQGQVVFVSPLVQAGNKYRVRAEVENRQEDGDWLLRPGMTATMVIHLQ